VVSRQPIRSTASLRATDTPGPIRLFDPLPDVSDSKNIMILITEPNETAESVLLGGRPGVSREALTGDPHIVLNYQYI